MAQIWGFLLTRREIFRLRTGGHICIYQAPVNGKNSTHGFHLELIGFLNASTTVTFYSGSGAMSNTPYPTTICPIGFSVSTYMTSRLVSFFPLCGETRSLTRLDIAKVPVVESGRFTYSKLENLPLKSQFSDQSAEGLYLRFEAEGWLVQRAKLVRPGFVQSIGEHWSRSAIKPNRLDWARA